MGPRAMWFIAGAWYLWPTLVSGWKLCTSYCYQSSECV